MTFEDAPQVLATPLAVEDYQRSRLWVPVCQYPVSERYRPGDGEQGMEARVDRRGRIRSVERRVFTAVSR